MKEYEVMVFDNDLLDDGRINKKPRGKETVTGESRQEVISLFRLSDQSVEFISERDLDVKDEPKTENPVPLTQEVKTDSETKEEIEIQKEVQPPVTENLTFIHQVKTKPKYYTVGGIEIKEDSGKIYQKQWITLNANEANNFRVVNDTTNKIVSLNGKHVEVKKWILVDNNEEETDTNLQFLTENN